MQIGDKLMLRPTVFGGGADLIDTQPRPCRVVYIHPLRRFFVVEFCAELTGMTWRETRYFGDRAIQARKDLKHANDSNL